MTDNPLDGALDLGRSFVVEGPAGCGKSELALQRYVAALCAADHPEEVLFLVDTSGAAHRARQRIAGLLRDPAGSDAPLAARNEQQQWDLLQQPERLQVHTLGSLAQSLVAAAPVSSGCGAGVRLTDNPDSYYLNAARALLRTLDHDERVAPNLETLLLHLDNDLVRAERLLGGMLRRRAELQFCLKLDDPDTNRPALQTALEDAVAMTLSDVCDAVPDDVVEELIMLASMAARQLSMRGSDSPIVTWRDSKTLPAADASKLKPWRGLCELLLTDDGQIRQSFDEHQGFPSAESADDAKERTVRLELRGRMEAVAARLANTPGFASRLRAVREVAEVRYTHLQWTVLQSLLAVLPRVVKDLTRAFRALGEMDLTEILQGATRALSDGQVEIFGPQGLQHLVAVNLEDMSFSGMELLDRLIRSWSENDGRSVFVTGNPFGSVCRSDGAQPALFLKILHNGLGRARLEMLTLDRQQRSGSNIVTWINEVFDAADITIGKGVMPLSSATATRADEGRVGIYSVVGGAAAETRQIVELLTAQPDLREDSIAVLLADGQGAAGLIDALRGAGIRCNSQAVDQLAQRSVITDLHALTRALSHLADRVSWLAVLRAPWCGLTLADLHRLVADTSAVAVWELIIDEQRRARLSEDGQQRLSRVKRVFAQTLAERGRRDLRRLVEGVWTSLGGAVCVRDEYELQQTRDYFRLLGEIDDGGEADSLEALDAAVEKLQARPARAATRTGEVFVTTIRNARRHEFGTVILAGLSTEIPLPEDDDALRWLVRPDQFGNAQLLLAPVSGEGGDDAINHWVESLQFSMHDNELRRLVYTGAACANDNLILIASAPGPDWAPPPPHSPLRAIWPVIEEQLPPEPDLVIDPAETAPAAHIRRLSSAWLLPEAPHSKVWRTRETQARQSFDPLDGLSDNARLAARVMRRTLTEIAVTGPMDWSMRSLDGLENRFRQLFGMMGMTTAEIPAAADRAGLAIANTLKDERARWLLNPTHDRSRSPLALTGWLDEALIEAEIDRSFVDDAGVRWIAAYCFPELDGGDDESLPDQTVTRYRPRWNDYARLARRFDPTPVRIGLYFPYSSQWREWDPEG